MASRIKGITVEIGGDTTGLDKALKSVDKTSRSLQSELTDVNKLLKFNPSSTELLAQKQKLLASQIDSVSDRLKALKEAQKQVDAQFKSGEISESQYRAFNREIINTESSLRSLQTQLGNAANQESQLQSKTKQLETLFRATGTSVEQFSDVLGTNLTNAIKNGTATSKQLDTAIEKIGQEALGSSVDLDKMKKALDSVDDGNSIKNVERELKSLSKEADDAKKSLTDIGNSMQSTGSEIATGFGAVTAVVGGGLAFATKKAADFEAQLSSMESVMSPDEVNEYGDRLKDLAVVMGADTKYSALEAAQGIEELAKAGVSVTDILDGGLEGALSLATAGELELAEAAEIASTALNAFRDDNVSVMQAADILAGAANASATSVKEMNYGLSQSAAVASGAGMSFKDTATALAVFAQNGLIFSPVTRKLVA